MKHAAPAPYAPRVSIDDWQRDAERIATEPDALAPFTAFADLEDAFEPLEEQLHELPLAIDREIQQRIDESRGKSRSTPAQPTLSTAMPDVHDRRPPSESSRGSSRVGLEHDRTVAA